MLNSGDNPEQRCPRHLQNIWILLASDSAFFLKTTIENLLRTPLSRTAVVVHPSGDLGSKHESKMWRSRRIASSGSKFVAIFLVERVILAKHALNGTPRTCTYRAPAAQVGRGDNNALRREIYYCHCVSLNADIIPTMGVYSTRTCQGKHSRRNSSYFFLMSPHLFTNKGGPCKSAEKLVHSQCRARKSVCRDARMAKGRGGCCRLQYTSKY